MKKITDKDVEALKAGKKVTKGFIHMQLLREAKILVLNWLRSYLRYINLPLICSQKIFLGLRINKQL